MDNNTQTISADPIISTTQHAPAESSFESQLNKQLKKPSIAKMDIRSLDAPPDNLVTEAPDVVMTPAGFDAVADQDIQSFLNDMDSKEQGPIEDEPKKTKADKIQDNIDASNFDLSDLDLASDAEPVKEEVKGKKSKEDNIAELRKKSEGYEEILKSKDNEASALRDKLTQLEAELERTAFERSPKFKDTYESPYQEAVKAASAFAQEIGDDETLATKALSLKGRERINFIDESFGGGAASAQFLNLINDADIKQRNLEGALTDYRATSTQIQQSEQEENAKTLEIINRNFDRVREHLGNKSEFFRLTGDEDHDKAVNERISQAKAIIHGNASQNELAAVPLLAVVAKEFASENAKLKAELSKYKNRASEDAKVQPRISKGSSSDEEETSKGRPKSALESIRSQLR